jgi:hypothetical protein
MPRPFARALAPLALLVAAGACRRSPAPRAESAAPAGRSSAAAPVATVAEGAAPRCPDGAPPPAEKPPRQKVTLRIKNGAASDRFVVAAGWLCDGYAILDGAGHRLPLRLGFQCGCDCPSPGPPFASSFRVLHPGERWDVEWDGRVLAGCTEELDCDAKGWKGRGRVATTVGARQPLPSGDYRVAVAFERALPPNCRPRHDGGFVCPPPQVAGTRERPSGQSFCPSHDAATARFTLPPSGDLVVEVPLE